MQNYEQAVGYVRNFLSDNHYCHTLVLANERCFKKLEAYLKQEGTDYTPQKADEWFSTYVDQVADTDRRHYKVALLRLRDIYECGKIRSEHDTRHFMSYTILKDGLKNSLDTFLLDLGKNLSPDTVVNYKQSCARFLAFMQKAGVCRISDITFDLLCTFYQADVHQGRWGKSQVNSHVSAMLTFFFKHHDVPYGFSILFHYLSHGKGCYWNTVSLEAHDKIASAMASSSTITARKLYEYKEISNSLHTDNKYSKTTISTNNRAMDLLILFLEMNGYGYNPEIAGIWFEETRRHFKNDLPTIRRSLCMAADYYHSAQIRLGAVYLTKPRAFDLLPEWCRKAADRYVDTKEKEGWKKSTMDMIRSSICRFCQYLDGIGIRSFREVDASHIKQFNTNDKHKTPHGKNAYNTRIRKFLIYLGEQGYLDNPMLFLSLTRTSAPKETIVVVLTKEEMDQLNEQLENSDGRLSLRKKAMLLLGLKMGMRSSDIVKLKIDDVDWNTASIRFVQEKTAVEVSLPMPAEVGNALFRYIMEERHSKADRNIFLSEKAPHKPVGRSVCGCALDTALPDRNVEGSGFHVTRKTYATNLLRGGVGAGMVAEALGQRGNSSVHRYLSLDTERMRMCPLSLEDCGIGRWGNGR